MLTQQSSKPFGLIFLKCAQIFLHFIVAADEADDERFRRCAKQDSKRKTDAAFEEVGA